MIRFQDKPRRPVHWAPSSAGGDAGVGGTLIGLAASGSVVLAADTRTKHGTVVRSASVQKLAPVHPTAAMGSTAELGASRRFVRSVRAEVNRYEASHGEPIDLAALATFAAGELRSNATTAAPFILGGVDADGVHVFTLSREAGVEETDYAALGSGRQLAYGVLEAETTKSLTLVEARRIAGRALESAIARDSSTGGQVRVAEITDAGVTLTEYASPAELK